MQSSVHLFLCGNMRIVGPGGEDVILRNRKTRAILAVLALAEGKRVSRSRLAGLFWDGSNDAQARMGLRHALSELNRFVNHRIPGLVEIDRTAVRVNTDLCWIDAFAPATHLERLLDDLDGISSAFDHWLAAEREKFEHRERESLERELKQLVEEDEAPELQAAAARKLINFDPTHEGAVRSLMTAFAKMGDRVQAIREYERCLQALRSKADLRPSKETVAVYDTIRSTGSGFNTAGPRHYRVPADVDQANPEPLAHPPGYQPSIAVLPFRNLSDENAGLHVSDGLVEDLIQALSRVPNLFVTSRLSSLAFRDQDRLPQDIGDALGVQYVLSGSIRAIGDRLRLTVELTDTGSGAVLWTSKLDEQFSDLLEVQERLAYSIVRRVGLHVHRAELKRARTKRLDDLGTYELFLRAQENMHNSSRAVFDTSEALFDEAIARDPGYATALAWRAYWHVLRVGQGWSPDPARDAAQAEHFARRALDCDIAEPMAFAVYGHIVSYLHKDFELAFQNFAAALDINPNAAQAWSWSAVARAWLGDGKRAIEEISKAIALSPYDPLMYAYTSNAGLAYLADGQYDRAIEYLLRSLRENQTYTSNYRLLVIASQLAGKTEQARRTVHHLLQLEPGLTVAKFRQRHPSAAAQTELYCDALAKAGLPPF
jgi:TolB-like protein/DNA-binding SARP family transcriptional activator/Tfp pilus assembly protein PilF